MSASPIMMVFAAALLALHSFSTPAKAETRRAFVVGVQSYSDGYIPQLRLSANDAKGVAKDLEEVGFDKKNIKVAVDLKNREAFEREFSAFLKTVEKGDTVVFFFSGHGFGIEADQTNYLLFSDLKSPFTFTREKLAEQDRRNEAVVRLRIPQFLDQYQQNEIPNGISTLEIQRRLAEKNPKTVVMILDACRTIIGNNDPNESEEEAAAKVAKRGKESGSRLINVSKPPPGFVFLYSASFGEEAVEAFTNRPDRNSLFTGVLRTEMMRPGQSIVELGERVNLVVRAIAAANGKQQEPEVFYNHDRPDVENFYLIGSIGRERFQIVQDRCEGDKDDWGQIGPQNKRELYERHRQRFDRCPNGTAELARRAIVEMGLSSDEPVVIAAPPVNRTISECDRLAASELDFRRPPEVPGVLWEKMDADAAIAACSKAIEDNPRVTRYLFNIGRAYQKLSSQPSLDEAARARAVTRARLAYEDAEKRGYESAMNNLAVLEELDEHTDRAIALLKRAAQAQHPLAMYNLGLHYRDANGVTRDRGQAKEYFAQAAEKNFVPAMVEFGNMLTLENNNRRGLEWLERAANLGSSKAKLLLGTAFFFARQGATHPDRDLALLWFGRVAEAGNSVATSAQAGLALMMEQGEGLPGKETESAAGYWRRAAYGGDAYAEAEFAERLDAGIYVLKEEYGEGEILTLLERAMSQGSVRAAVLLAEIYRNGEHGVARNPVQAMKLAYRAIDLAVQTEPTITGSKEVYDAFYEISAAHLLVEMAKSGEAVDARGRPLLTQDETDRLDHYYGKINAGAKKVNVRLLTPEISCGFFDSKKKFYDLWPIKPSIWVWDWGRAESPTDLQIRDIERNNNPLCIYNLEKWRETLRDIFNQSKKSNVPFADLTNERISVLNGAAEAPNRRGDRPRHR